VLELLEQLLFDLLFQLNREWCDYLLLHQRRYNHQERQHHQHHLQNYWEQENQDFLR
jgi:hypothetical protein